MQKLHYLKTSVTGEAALLINHIQIADTNYDAAWKLLNEEYDNPRAIIHAHIHNFTDLPKMKTETAAELKNLRDTVAVSLAALTNLERPVDKWDDLLVYIISQIVLHNLSKVHARVTSGICNEENLMRIRLMKKFANL